MPARAIQKAMFVCAAGVAVAAFDGGQAAQTSTCRFQGPLAVLPELPEASGLALSRRHPRILWSHNDSGRPRLFAIGFEGAVRARIPVGDVKTRDWEDVGVAPCPQGSCVYIADIGDNNAVRDSITIYRVPEPDLQDRAADGVEAFHATYPDGPHDAEALAATSANDLFLFTKGREKEIAVYRFPAPLAPNTTARLERLGTLDPALVKERVTGANASPDGRWVVVRTHHSVLFFRTSDLAAGHMREASRFDIRRLEEPQGEGVALAADGTVYLAGEGGGRVGSFGAISCTLGK